ncbi:hypothetical protein KY290_033449 [Solanum tuberosum]|uniref:Uncharacterized protein n=1 Tax=Solanum tuberosum TaxID=4113 RepID=A0ABQ7U0R5_SOLTU|nr:hypothetical protein KY289_032803 [Solanum tuberosum]KAH0647450.1 hypothetical protein KY285_032698 [Solanum tuberosum]KAH0740406.1 hypothetical protein KY290_033449 [Solanum tuberosum]
MAAKNTNQNLELIHGVGHSSVHSKKPTITMEAKKPPKFYSADDIKKPFVNQHKSKPTKLKLLISNLLSKLRKVKEGRRRDFGLKERGEKCASSRGWG